MWKPQPPGNLRACPGMYRDYFTFFVEHFLSWSDISPASYVYWTVHHIDSWVKRDQLDATCFIITLFSAQRVSDVNTSILRSLRLIRWVTSCVVSRSKCVVMLQCGHGGVVSVCRIQLAAPRLWTSMAIYLSCSSKIYPDIWLRSKDWCIFFGGGGGERKFFCFLWDRGDIFNPLFRKGIRGDIRKQVNF